MRLEVDELINAVPGGEAPDGLGLVLPHALHQSRRHADIEGAVAPAGQHVDVELLVHCPPRTRMRVRSHVIPAGSWNPGWGAHDAESPATWMPALRFREGRLFAGMTIIHPGRTLNIYLSTVTLLHRGAWLGGGP